MELIAHRGASFDAPENSLEAFDRAIAQGATRLELDIQLTLDGVPVVNHDTTTDRTGDRALAIEAVTLEELRQVRLGNGEPIPTFAEVCEHIAGRAELDVELKATAPRVAQEILATMRAHNLLDQGLISSFDAEVLRVVRTSGYRGRTGLVVGSDSLNIRQRVFEAWPFRALDYAQANDLIIQHRLYHPLLKSGVRRRGGQLLFWMSMEDETQEPARRQKWYERIARIQPDGVILARCSEAQPFLSGDAVR